MSGICGFYEPGREPSSVDLEQMLQACALPGELGRERSVGKTVALAVSQRWSGQQVGELSGVRIAIDTDLLNLEEISKRLIAEGVPAGELSVAQKLARLDRLRGLDFLRDLQGAFAVALWDEHSHTLLLAVDRFAFRNLHWCREGNRILFSTRVTGVRAAQNNTSGVNPKAIAQLMLYSAIPAPLTIFDSIQRINPGFALIFNNGGMQSRHYWDLTYPEQSEYSERHWSGALREEMRSAVHRALSECSDHNTGAYLSGGTDSSSVVAFMSDRFRSPNSFSISFPVEGFNEIEFARTTAARFGTKHYERCLSPEDARAAIPKLVRYYDEPFANSSAIASYHCALLARESGVNLLLAGDGGDELFGGNARYATDKRFGFYQTIPQWLRRGVIEPWANRLPAGDGPWSLPRRYVRRANLGNPRRILSYNLLLNTDLNEVFEPDFLRGVENPVSLEFAEQHFHNAKASTELNRLLYMDVKMTLSDNDLRKVTGTAELAGVQVRYPLLDTHLAEFSGRIPSRLKLKGMRKRYIFKKAMEGILPEKVLYKKKHGFGVPLGEWFLRDRGLNSLVREVLHDPRTRQRGYFRESFMTTLLRSHEQEHAGFYGEFVWYLLALELWHREHLGKVQEAQVVQ